MKNIFCAILFISSSLLSRGQIIINNSIQPQIGDSIRITNVGESKDSTELISLINIRENKPQFYTPIYTGDSIPVSIYNQITSLNNGLIFYIKATSENKGPVKLYINNNYFPLVNNNKSELKKGQIIPEKIIVAVYLDSSFIYINPEKPSCPNGFIKVNDAYCIEKDEHNGTFWTAAMYCQNIGANLCSWSEWYYACQQSGSLGLNSMTNNWEWIKWAKNEPNQAATVGNAGCTYTLHRLLTTNSSFRCCFGL